MFLVVSTVNFSFAHVCTGCVWELECVCACMCVCLNVCLRILVCTGVCERERARAKEGREAALNTSPPCPYGELQIIEIWARQLACRSATHYSPVHLHPKHSPNSCPPLTSSTRLCLCTSPTKAQHLHLRCWVSPPPNSVCVW